MSAAAPRLDPADAVALLDRLVGFDTVSARSNLDCVTFIRDYLAGHGVEAVILPDATGTKASLFATIGPQLPGGVVLSGHTDVVPAEEPGWTTDPFCLSERDGRLYGRGTCDMKGFDALMLAAVPAILAARLPVPVHLALSHDEEVGCLGAPALVAAMKAAIAPPRAVIVGEPTMMVPVIGHKTSLTHFTRVTGHSVHSSRIDIGVSAVMVAARLIAWHDGMMTVNRRRAGATGFAPPYTTLHCGMVRGGVAANIVAADCEFVTDIRAIPDEDEMGYRRAYQAFIDEEVLPAMHAIAPQSGVEVVPRSHVPGLVPEPGGGAATLAALCSGTAETGLESYATEAGVFQRAGWSSVVCGPGSIAQAHKADEYLERSQLLAGCAFFDRLIEELRG